MSIMQVQRKTGVVVFGGSVLAVLVTAATAWACTATASLSASPGEAPAGSRVMVTGGQLGSGPVELRWDSTTGPVLTTAQGPDFTVAVTIPSSANVDTHLIYASNSTYPTATRVVFQVVPGTPNQPRNTARSGSRGTNAGSSISGAGDAGSDTSGSIATQGSGAVSSESGAGFPAATGSPAGAQPSTARETSGTSSNQTALAPAAQTAATATPDSAGRPIGAQATAAPGDEPTRATPGAEAAEAAGPSPASATGDPWSGFEPGRSLERGASLIDPASDSSSLPLQAGVLAFGGALVALFAGFGVAELRRARVKAH